MLNHPRNGGYLGWALQTPVFIDGRSIVFKGLGAEVRSKPLAQIVARYGVNYLVLTHWEYNVWRVKPNPRSWALVYWDDFRAVFIPRIPAYQDVIERHEYRVVPPFGAVPSEVFTSPRLASDARAELSRVVAHSPSSQRALLFLSSISRVQGDFARAAVELERALEVRPTEEVAKQLAKVLNKLEQDEIAGASVGETRTNQK